MKIFAAFVFSFLLSRCVASTAGIRVPSRTYYESGNAELVESCESGLTFTIRVPKLSSRKVFTRGPYRYAILPSGRIHVEAPSNDSIYLFGIWRFAWFWNGKNIVRKDVKRNRIRIICWFFDVFNARKPYMVFQLAFGSHKKNRSRRMQSFRGRVPKGLNINNRG
jgi:hypothetical protein